MIQSAVVSQVVPVGFADLAQAADELPGEELADDRVHLHVLGRLGSGQLGAVRFAGTLRAAPTVIPPMKVEVIVSPWSANRSEVAIRPLTNIGEFDSLRANRFFNAAHSILPTVIEHLTEEAPAEVRAALEPAA